MISTRSAARALTTAALLAAPLTVLAQAEATASARQLPLWELGLGVGGLHLPHYRGADQAHGWLLPVPYYAYRGPIFKADRDGARAVLLDRRDAEVDISLSASPPLRSRDNRARAGMADLKPLLELGPNLNLTLQRQAGWKLDLRLPLRAALTVQHSPQFVGWSSTPNLNLDVRDLAGWNLGLLAGPVLGSRGLHGHFYDVDAAQATPGRPAFRAAGGFAGVQALAALSRRDGQRWSGLFVKLDSLHGAAFADSPLVRQRLQWSAGFAVSWVLLQSDTLVAAER